jgi:hypothetical protein
MTTRIGAKTGNFTTAGTWLVVDSTSLNDTEANNTALTTSYVESASFTPGAIVVDGIAFKVASRASGAASNTLTGRIALGGADVAGTPTTMNVSDIDVSDTGNIQGGWYYLRFNVAGTPTSVTLAAATAYTVSFKLSATTTAVNLYRSSTAGDWARMLGTRTTGAPAAGDNLHIMGDNLAAGTKNSYTVTNDNTATTSFGTLASSKSSLSINKGGTLTYGTSASTNYYLRIKGLLVVYSSGTLNIGTSGTRMPSTSTATLEWDATANGDSGLEIRDNAIVNIYGDNGRSTWATLLTADAAAAATSLTVASATGWQNTDTIVIASTDRTASHTEKKTMSNVSGTTLTVPALGFAHSGTSPTQAEVINLTRNIVLRSNSTTNQGYAIARGISVVNIDYAEFIQMGCDQFGSKSTFSAQTTSGGTCSVTHCSLHDTTVGNAEGFVISGSAATGITFSHNVTYNLTINHFRVAATSGTWTADDNVFMLNSDGGNATVTIADIGGTFTHVTITGAVGPAMNFGEAGADGSVGTFSDWTLHSNAGSLQFNAACHDMTIGGTNAIWRSNSRGIQFTVSGLNGLTFGTLTMFGNTTSNILVSSVEISNVTLNNFTSSGDTTFTTTSGIEIASPGGMVNSAINSGDFGTVTGIKTAHTQDILLPSGASGQANMSLVLSNTKMASAIEVSNLSGMTLQSYISSEKHDQTAGLHKTWRRTGILQIEGTTVHTGSQSMSLTPNSASQKLDSGGWDGGMGVAVNSGDTVTFTAYVYKHASYNGNQPRLIVKRNDAIGITSDTVLATYASGTGAWNALSGTTVAANDDGMMEFVVDCDGTAGAIYVDSLAAA